VLESLIGVVIDKHTSIIVFLTNDWPLPKVVEW